MPITVINKAPMCPVKLSDYSLETAQEACNKCITILTQAIAILQQEKPTQEQSEMVTKYFLSAISDMDIRQKLVTTLTQTRDGLQTTDITLTVNNFNSAKKGVPAIHIAPAQFKNPNQILRYMIHEATHVFAGTTDAADWGYIKNDGEFKMSGIQQETAIVNADSFAVFAVRCFNLPLV
jgi:hypothetical protein